MSGQTGAITADLEIEYTGGWAEEVTEYAHHVKEGHTDDGENIRVEDAVNQIMIELPDIAPIIEVKRDE